jgi:hypothetical protein
MGAFPYNTRRDCVTMREKRHCLSLHLLGFDFSGHFFLVCDIVSRT